MHGIVAALGWLYGGNGWLAGLLVCGLGCGFCFFGAKGDFELLGLLILGFWWGLCIWWISGFWWGLRIWWISGFGGGFWGLVGVFWGLRVFVLSCG